MATIGRKQLTYHDRKKLFRTTPRNIRTYSSTVVTSKFQHIIDSFTCEDYQMYEELLHYHKRPSSLTIYCQNNKVSQPISKLSELRESDQRAHQKVVQILRHKWTDKWETDTMLLNENEDKFWYRMAASIQRSIKDRNIDLHPEWQGANGRVILINFLKNKYKEQNGLCALTKEPMLLEIGIREKNERKCSPDRKNSNKGYTPDNFWFVVWWANAMKMDMPLDVFRKRIKILSENI
jgi:hypothetical protein